MSVSKLVESLQCRMSAFGPKQTSASALHMSAFGGKADMTFYSGLDDDLREGVTLLLYVHRSNEEGVSL